MIEKKRRWVGLIFIGVSIVIAFFLPNRKIGEALGVCFFAVFAVRGFDVMVYGLRAGLNLDSIQAILEKKNRKP